MKPLPALARRPGSWQARTSRQAAACRRIIPCRQRGLGYALLAALLCCAAAVASAGEAGGPGATVERFHGKLLEVMQRAGELGYQGRYQELAPYLSDCFDTPLIAEVILGGYRERLSAAQRAEFTDLFRRYSTATYAARFNGYDGEEFLERSRESLRRGRVLIRTELRRRAADPVSLDYLLHEKQGKWYIISVSANGVNDLSLKRAEYAAVIKEKGYNGLAEDISSKIEELENNNH